jgi:predicted acyltransferase
MMLGSLIGDWLRRTDVASLRKLFYLAIAALVCVAVGLAWAQSLGFNAVCWTPSYLLYATGIGAIIFALIYYAADVLGWDAWTRPLVVFGVNAIAAYWLSLMFSTWLLDYPRVGRSDLRHWIVASLQSSLGTSAGAWAFTLGAVAGWWIVFDQLYRRRLLSKV